MAAALPFDHTGAGRLVKSAFMAATIPGRPLGHFETALTLTGEHAPFAIVVVVRLDGAPPPQTVRRALDTVQGEQPLLRARIVGAGGRYRFAVDAAPPPISLRTLPREGEDHWRRVAEEELNRGVDAAATPLLRCHLLPAGDDAADLILTFHHAIVDATACERLVDRLLALAAGTAGPRPPVATLPPAAGSLLPPGHRGLSGLARRLAFLARQIADEAAWRRHHRGRAPTPGQGRCHVLPIGLDADETAGLVRRARRRRVTLAAALDAALLQATVRHLPALDAGIHRHVTFADLRPYLKPSPDAEHLGCYISMLRHTVDGVSADPATFWPLARRITGQVGAAAHRGDKFAAARFAPMVMRRILGGARERMASTAVSYSGVAGLDRRHGAVTVRDLRAYVSNFPLGPPCTAAARLLGDELRIDLLYLDCDLDAAGAQRVGATLLALLRGEGTDDGGDAEDGP